MGVVRALVRDVVATIALKDEAAFMAWLIEVAEQAKANTCAREGVEAFESYLVGDVQQHFHDEFVDVSWPRCPRHPLWFEDGAWRCTKDNVSFGKLGELAAMARRRV